MKKAELFAQYQEAKDTGKEIDSVILYIHMPGGEEEIIINPVVADKMDYINRTYNDDLVHTAARIFILSMRSLPLTRTRAKAVILAQPWTR